MDHVSTIATPTYALPDIGSLFRLLMQLLLATIFGRTMNKSKSMPSLEEYDIDSATGFFPPQSLAPLTGAFELWERALEEAKKTLSLGSDKREDAMEKRTDGEAWRESVRSLPILDTECFEGDIRRQQRAHMVLAFLINFYVHSQPPASDPSPIHIPSCLAIPMVNVSRILGTAPIMTFADVVLWNWKPLDPELPLSSNNVGFMHHLSGTEAEHEFYVLSAKAEIRGIEMLRIVDSYVHQKDTTSFVAVSKISKDLTRLAAIIQELTEIIARSRETVDPYIFYWHVRPWWNGSGASGPNAPKWIYDGVPDSDTLDLGGPSAGQSTVMHALDVFLDVDHKLQKKRSPAPSNLNTKADKGFMERMRRYMPGKHQAFLVDFATIPISIRTLAERTPLLREPFDTAVLALKKFRDAHIRIVCLYVVSMSSTIPPGSTEKSPREKKTGPARGTGGSELSTLLKAGRDATNRTMLRGN
ncbi:hypothetical protein EW146_g1697 [Bondarzewia mesenterica]|uniref:Indoleamine 2,3-dioxygenase n=1 Tax=Bondarzewia mesenterica TaxID=1095465 RepID=A0A4S4M4U8_9AGAM|nr:hypothetical protein EW146_g1697 [Bondarzewia mesenterica]